MIAALVPAAGSSTRMGRPKLLVELEGQTLIGRVVTALRMGGADRVVVVAPPADTVEGPQVAAQAESAGAQVIVPRTRPAEMRESIEIGLEALEQLDRPQSILLTPADYPGLTSEIVAELTRCARKMPDRMIIPRYRGERGHPIVVPWPIAALVRSLPAGAGVNVLLAEHQASLVELDLANPAILADLDTPQDLLRWQQQQGRIRVSVRLFALAKERAGRPELELELAHGSKVADLRSALGKAVPALAPLLSTALIAVDEEYADDDTLIQPGSRLAVIPPVSGGGGDHEGPGPSQSLTRGTLPQ
jgi:molybdenum cofactor cytidylyltransferase